MISFSPVWAVVLRHARMWRRDYNYLLGGLYWPLLDVLVWGFLGTWIAKSQTALPNYETAALLGILLWQVVGRGCNIMVISVTEELWSRNMVNLFSMPLRTVEWMCGIVLFSMMAMTIISAFCMSVIWLLYNVSMWYMISTFLIFFPPLFFTCLWISFTSLQIVVTLGKRSAELSFIIGWFLLPFSGAYYPIEVLPAWAQTVSDFLPLSYVFQAMRAYVMHQQDPTSYLMKGYILGILYAIIAILLFMYCFNRTKKYGLAQLSE